MLSYSKSFLLLRNISFGEPSTLKNYSSSHNSFQYTTEQYESENQLVYLRARYYNPEISHDPFAGQMDKPQSKNMYAYVSNNPLRFTDPSGLVDWASAATGLISGAGAVAQTVAGGVTALIGGAGCLPTLGAGCVVAVGGTGVAALGLNNTYESIIQIYNAFADEKSSWSENGLIRSLSIEYFGGTNGNIYYDIASLAGGFGAMARPILIKGTISNSKAPPRYKHLEDDYTPQYNTLTNATVLFSSGKNLAETAYNTSNNLFEGDTCP